MRPLAMLTKKRPQVSAMQAEAKWSSKGVSALWKSRLGKVSSRVNGEKQYGIEVRQGVIEYAVALAAFGEVEEVDVFRMVFVEVT